MQFGRRWRGRALGCLQPVCPAVTQPDPRTWDDNSLFSVLYDADRASESRDLVRRHRADRCAVLLSSWPEWLANG